MEWCSLKYIFRKAIAANMFPHSQENKKQVVENGRRGVTPLWVVSLFVSLTETVLGVGVIHTSGGIQVALTTFMIVFALLVAAAFFLILGFRPYVFYPPTE